MAEKITGTILLVDDDRIILDSLSEMLRLDGHHVDTATSVEQAMPLFDRRTYEIVVTDINMPGVGGFELLRAVKTRFPETAVLVITGYGTIESAVEAIKMGAYDYLTKPIIDDEIHLAIGRALEQHRLVRQCRVLRDQLDQRYGLDNIVGQDYKMGRVFDLIEAVAESKVNVLIEGESGTGKSMIARAIHHRSDRRDQPFVEVSCGAIPETLLESELFGHVRGAFTGAVSDKPGKFKAADRGTLFLDEIASASPALQVKLLRVVQEREFEPVGSNKTQHVDVRIIMATNVDLSDEVAAGRFRQDLYYRVNVVTVTLPRLGERMGDIPLLADTFLKKYVGESNKHVRGFTEGAIRALQRYAWPGNVRELENAVERAVVLTKSNRIDVDDLPPRVLETIDAPVESGQLAPLPLRIALEDPERRIIEAALRHNDWNRQATADQLEINRTTLYKKMKRYGLEADPRGHVLSR